VNWVDKTDQSITQHCSVHIHMSGYEDRVWCDVFRHRRCTYLLDRHWLYDLNITSLGTSNTYEFKLRNKNNVETYKTQVECRE